MSNGLIGSVVVVALRLIVVSSPGGVNALWVPPPPPPQLARSALASSGKKVLRKAFMSNLQARVFMWRSSLRQRRTGAAAATSSLQVFVQNARSHENQQLRFLIAAFGVAEQRAERGHV